MQPRGQQSLEMLYITIIVVLFSIMIVYHYIETKDTTTALVLLKSDLTQRITDYEGSEFVRINTILFNENAQGIDFNVLVEPNSVTKIGLYPGGDLEIRTLIEKHTTYLKDNISISVN